MPHFCVDAMKQLHCTDESQILLSNLERVSPRRTNLTRRAAFKGQASPTRAGTMKIELRKRQLPIRRDAILLAALLIAGAAAVPLQAQSRRVSVSEGKISRGAPYNLPMGKVLPFQLPKRFTFQITEGEEFIKAVAENGVLTVTPQKVGRATLVVEAPNYAPVAYSIRVLESAATPPVEPLPAALPVNSGTSVTVTPATMPSATVARIPAQTTVPNQAQSNAIANNARPEVPAVATAPNTTMMAAWPPANHPAATQAPLASQLTESSLAAPAALPSLPAPMPSSPQAVTSLPLEVRALGNAEAAAHSGGVARTADALPPLGVMLDAAQISPSLPAPARSSAPAFPTRSQLPQNVAAAARNTNIPRNAVAVTQGLARLFRFPSNILAVFFSDVAVMDARAVNARTVAITGLAPGASTLAVFTERFPGDAVGRSHVYQIAVRPSSATNVASTQTGSPRNAADVETAIRTALNDPRIGVGVILLPNGTLAARLTGTVRDVAEIEAARATAALFVPQVVSALYAEKTAPTLDAAGALPSEQQFQAQLRQLTGNTSIEFITLPTGVALKAEVGSVEEANALLNLLPDLGRPLTPFIVIRGAAGAASTYYDRPVLTGQDAEMTRRMQTVTGVKTVYAVRVTSNPATPTDYGIAIYGTVRDRTEYDTVRRFAILFTQSGGSVSGGASNGNIRTSEASNLISTGYRQPVGIHMFVRILDSRDAVVRRVTAETSVVEISRTALRNLGVQVGSVALLSETVTPATPPLFSEGGNLLSPGTPGTINRTIDPNFIAGQLTGGNGFAGGQGFGNLDPLRLRLNALFQKGNARILSQPNISAVEGADAQITIGGTRPIPITSTTGGGAGSVNNSVVFRNFGIILTMRPTLTDDDTIILQIRADVTNIDPTTAVNLGGAIIPGETVRSVNTTITVREGDTIVMGGLITNERSQITSRIPVLSNIPILGSLFRSKRFQNNESELAIFMTPRITRTPASMNTREDVQRVPALPDLPANQTTTAAFSSAFGGAAAGGG
jgi:Flp pilus assembly secretin CpaC